MRKVLLIGAALAATTLSADPDPAHAHQINTLPKPGTIVIDAFSLPVLRALEKTHRFGAVLGGAPAVNLQKLGAANSRYASVTKRLTADLAFMRRQILGRVDRAHGFIIRDMVYNSAEAYATDREGDTPRQLNPTWLVSRFARFRLIAVINRFDKIDTDPAGCGEVRLVYRLAYRVPDRRRGRERKVRYASLLPVLFNVVLEYPKAPDCSVFARRWRLDRRVSSPDDYAEWLRKGPLAAPLRFKQLEVNLQSLRFTAGYMKDIGGQAMYILRIFRPDPKAPGRLVPAPLENVPDVVRLKLDARLRRKMIDFLAQTAALKAADRGTIVLPNIDGKLLSKIAISFSTLGRARLANKPFTDLMLQACQTGAAGKSRNSCKGKMAEPTTEAERLKGPVSKAGLEFVRTVRGLVDRLDNRTCMGCHQSGGTAGFHILGMSDSRLADPYNQTAVPYSAHYHAERARRLAYLTAVLAGQKPNRFRSHSAHPPARWPGKGLPKLSRAQVKEACLPSGRDYAIGPRCGTGTVCRVTVANRRSGVAFGECVVKRPASGRKKPVNRALFAGHTCRTGRLLTAQRFDARTANWQAYLRAKLPANFLDFRVYFRQGPKLYRDLHTRRQTNLYSCRPPVIGVPLGRTYRSCRAAERRMTVFDAVEPTGAKRFDLAALRRGRRPKEICALVGGTAFEKCAATNDVLTCLKAKGIARGMLDTCWPGRFCREDYICQRLPLDAAKSRTERQAIRALNRRHIGFCTPTYFVFAMRADGHPDPVTGIARTDRPRSQQHRGGYSKKFGTFRWRGRLR